ncbi:MAG: hypothetical protein KQJ78_07410 [Deltaproteobacteria bacterium]|nr:hypothetical protein [Deltaproteobacteria bacterium]
MRHAALILLCLWALGPALAAPAAGPPGPAPPPSSAPVCPLANPAVKVNLPRHQLAGRVGQNLELRVELSPPTAPSGFYYSVLVDVLQHPPGPGLQVVSGAPKTTIRCAQAGSYVLRVRVVLIAKSSCGGAKATILSEDQVRLDITT